MVAKLMDGYLAEVALDFSPVLLPFLNTPGPWMMVFIVQWIFHIYLMVKKYTPCHCGVVGLMSRELKDRHMQGLQCEVSWSRR